MDMAVIIIVGLEALFFLAMIGLLIYFIVQRVERKKHETFEDRDN
jgi:preprotein translocase subunit YajC